MTSGRRRKDSPDAPAEATAQAALDEAPAEAPRVEPKPASAPTSGSSTSAGASAYPPPAPVPTQAGPKGMRFDFNQGCRVMLPKGDWRVRLSDLDTGNILYETQADSGGVFVSSAKRFYVRFRVEAWRDGKSLMVHDFDPNEREVLIQFPVGTLGDILAWFPYAVRFKEKHGCRLTCAMAANMIALLAPAYPDIAFVTHAEVDTTKPYATYSIGLFFDDADNHWQPVDFRHVGLHRTAAYILGVDPADTPPRLALPDESRPIPEPYVCIAVHASTQCKQWNNPRGWIDIVAFLKEAGYRVICIDRQLVHGQGLVWTQIPHGAEDQTGDRPLAERARWLRHAAFFVGLSSGLSWLAWAAGTPVVLISGFTYVDNEFATPYRVINYHACNGCWNDIRHRFDHHDFMWCPRHAGTPRQFECTRLITVDQVKATVRRIPGFAEVTAAVT